MIVQTITLPYLEKILISKKRNPRYYNKIKKKGTNKIPPSYISKIGTKYEIDKDGFLLNIITKQRIISNPRTVGQAKFWPINFQGLYSNFVYPQLRAGYINQIKDHIRPYFHSLNKVVTFPIKVEFTIYSKELKIDVDNKSVLYIKCYQDLLTKEKIIPDDSSEYINNVEYKWIRSEREEMEFKIIEL